MDNSNYTGDWYDGLMHGKGRYNYADGSYYVGEFSRDAMHGEGVYTFSSGNVYRGSFNTGKMHGQGELFRRDTGEHYSGGFADGRRHGYLVEKDASGNIIYAHKCPLPSCHGLAPPLWVVGLGAWLG